MPQLGKVDGYILAHKGKVALHPNPWGTASYSKRSLYRRLINWLTWEQTERGLKQKYGGE